MKCKPIIFENHFDEKVTVVVGNWCINGCQTFHKNDAEIIFNKFNVPENYRRDVMNAFSDDEIDFDVLCDTNFGWILQPRVDILIAFICDDVKRLIKFIEDANNNILALLAHRGIEELDLKLMYMPSGITIILANNTKSILVLEHLSNSNYSYVALTARDRLNGVNYRKTL